jgi:hypothetical protein
VPIRILGVACTTHGFAFVTTECTDRILDWGKRSFLDLDKARDALKTVVMQSQPLFVASEMQRNEKRSDRGRCLNTALRAVCDERQLMILSVDRARLAEGGEALRNQVLAEAMARQFPVLAGMLTRPRRVWDGVDDRIGILLAVAAASVAWRQFRPAGSRGDRINGNELLK